MDKQKKTKKKKPKENAFYDKSFKELFARPEIVKNFFKGFVEDQDFVNDIDFNSIHSPNTNFISKLFKDRRTDLILQLKLKSGSCAYLYALFEFQSTPDKFISLRILTYILLFYQHLIKNKDIPEDGLLPPVFPVLVYTDKEKLTAPVHVEDLIVKPYKRLMKYLPRFEHYRITLKELSEEKEKLNKMRKLDNNILAAIFLILSSASDKEYIETAEALNEMIDAGTDLGRFLGMWLIGYLKYKNVDADIRINEGGKIMLVEFLKEKEKNCIKQGKEEVAKNLIKINMPIEQIAQVTGLPIESIETIIKSN